MTLLSITFRFYEQQEKMRIDTSQVEDKLIKTAALGEHPFTAILGHNSRGNSISDKRPMHHYYVDKIWTRR